MFGLFSNQKKTIGLDIKAKYIRFIEMQHDNYEDRIISYGEIVPEEELFRGNIIMDEKKLIEYLRKIISKTKTRNFVVSLPESFNKESFYDIFRHLNIKVKKYLSPASALSNSCVPAESPATFLVILAEDDMSGFATFGAMHNTFYVGSPENHSIISNLNRIYIDWYDEHKEKLSHVLVAGSRAKDSDFIGYVSRETKIPITRANIFTNLRHNDQKVPIITRDDSYKYAVAVGLAIS